jgi:hypothetical protein
MTSLVTSNEVVLENKSNMSQPIRDQVAIVGLQITLINSNTS